MPAPLQVDSNVTGLPVWSVDNAGNVIQVGTLTLQGALITTGATTLPALVVTGATTLAATTVAGAAAGGLLQVTNTVAATPGDLVLTEAAAANIALALQVAADTNARLAVDATGKLLWGSGSGSGDTDLYRVASGILQTDGTFQVLLDQNVGGNINAITVGKGLAIKEGSNAKSGTSALTAGSVVVANTSVTASSRIQLTSNADGGAPGWLRVSARTAGVSFTITSSSGTDTSTVAWLLVEPA